MYFDRKGAHDLFRIGDSMVHPMHGAGYVDDIVERVVSGTKEDYYVMRLSSGGMVVMVPVQTSGAIGVRCAVCAETAKAALESFGILEPCMTDNWNRRYRENMVRLKSGDIMEVAAVVRGLLRRDKEKGLSTGERKMLHSAKQILFSELSMVLSISYEQIESEIGRLIK